MSVAAGPEAAPGVSEHKGTWKNPEHHRENRTWRFLGTSSQPVVDAVKVMFAGLTAVLDVVQSCFVLFCFLEPTDFM